MEQMWRKDGCKKREKVDLGVYKSSKLRTQNKRACSERFMIASGGSGSYEGKVGKQVRRSIVSACIQVSGVSRLWHTEGEILKYCGRCFASPRRFISSFTFKFIYFWSNCIIERRAFNLKYYVA